MRVLFFDVGVHHGICGSVGFHNRQILRIEMILILGGFAQGKRQYAEEKYPGKMIHGNLAEMFRQRMKENGEPEKEIAALADRYPDAVFISDEVGSGVVPMDRFEREYRERLGRCLCELAKRAETVERVFCGLGTKIK